MQEAQAKTPRLAGVRQADQQIGDLFILGPQRRAIAITGLANPEGPACQRNADTSSFHCSFGHLAALTHGK